MAEHSLDERIYKVNTKRQAAWLCTLELHGHFQAARLMLNCNCLNLNWVAAIKARSSPPLSTLYGPVCNRSPHRYAPDPVAGRVVRLPSRASGDSTTIGGALGRRLQLDHPLSAGTACRQRPQTCARLTWIYGSTPRSLLCGSSVREVENLLARCNVKVKTAQNVQSKRQRRPAA